MILVLAGAMLTPGASGTSPRPPLEVFLNAVKGEPQLGQAFEVTFEAWVHADVEPFTLHLVVPGWVLVGGPDWLVDLEPGSSSKWTWQLTATREGVWGLQLEGRPSDAWSGSCCDALFFSLTGEGHASWQGRDGVAHGPLVPRGAVEVRHTVEASGAEATLAYEVVPLAPWLSWGNLSVEVDGHRPPDFAQYDVVHDGRTDAPFVVHEPFRLQPGINDILQVRLVWTTAAAPGSVPVAVELDCRSVSALLVDGAAQEDWSRGCTAMAARPGLGVPALSPSWLVLGLAAVAVGARRVGCWFRATPDRPPSGDPPRGGSRW